MKRYGTLALVCAALFALPLQAAEKPSGDEVKRVMTYYSEGSEAVLVESKYCKSIEKSGANKNECAEVLADGAIPSKESGYLWMNFLVPGSEKVNMLVQFKHKGRVLDSDEVKMSSAMRYRTWKRLQTHKAGEWEVSIEQETENGYAPIANLKYTVADTAAQ